MNAKVSAFVICVEAIIYLLLYNLHDCTFNARWQIDGNCSSKECKDILMNYFRQFAI